jgi:hypothetical protein
MILSFTLVTRGHAIAYLIEAIRVCYKPEDAGSIPGEVIGFV